LVFQKKYKKSILERNFMTWQVWCQGKKPGFTAENAERAEKDPAAKKRGDGKSSLAPVQVSLQVIQD
jgi:hypothetical protein